MIGMGKIPQVFHQIADGQTGGPVRKSMQQPLDEKALASITKTLDTALKQRIFWFTHVCASIEPQLHSDLNIKVKFEGEREQEFSKRFDELVAILNVAAGNKFQVAINREDSAFMATFSAQGFSLEVEFVPSGANTPLLRTSIRTAGVLEQSFYVSSSKGEYISFNCPQPNPLFTEKIENAAVALMNCNPQKMEKPEVSENARYVLTIISKQLFKAPNDAFFCNVFYGRLLKAFADDFQEKYPEISVGLKKVAEIPAKPEGPFPYAIVVKAGKLEFEVGKSGVWWAVKKNGSAVAERAPESFALLLINMFSEAKAALSGEGSRPTPQ